MKMCYSVGRHRLMGETTRAVIPSWPLISLYKARPVMSYVFIVTLWLHSVPFTSLIYVRVKYQACGKHCH